MLKLEIRRSPLGGHQAERRFVPVLYLQIPLALYSAICVLQVSVSSPFQSWYLLLAVQLLAVWDWYLPILFPVSPLDEVFYPHRGWFTEFGPSQGIVETLMNPRRKIDTLKDLPK